MKNPTVKHAVLIVLLLFLFPKFGVTQSILNWRLLFKQNCQKIGFDTTRCDSVKRTYHLNHNGEYELYSVQYVDSLNTELISIHLVQWEVMNLPNRQTKLDTIFLKSLIGQKQKKIQKKMEKKLGSQFYSDTGQVYFKFKNVSDSILHLNLVDNKLWSSTRVQQLNDSTTVKIKMTTQLVADKYPISKAYHIDTCINNLTDSTKYESSYYIDSFNITGNQRLVYVYNSKPYSKKWKKDSWRKMHSPVKVVNKPENKLASRDAFWNDALSDSSNQVLKTESSVIIKLSNSFQSGSLWFSKISRQMLHDSIVVYTYTSNDSFYFHTTVKPLYVRTNPREQTKVVQKWQHIETIDTLAIRNGTEVLLSSDSYTNNGDIIKRQVYRDPLSYNRRVHVLTQGIELFHGNQKNKKGRVFYELKMNNTLVDKSLKIPHKNKLYTVKSEALREQGYNSRGFNRNDSVGCDLRLSYFQPHRYNERCYLCFATCEQEVGDTVFLYELGKDVPIYFQGVRASTNFTTSLLYDYQGMLAFVKGEFDHLGLAEKRSFWLKKKVTKAGTETTYFYDDNRLGKYNRKVIVQKL